MRLAVMLALAALTSEAASQDTTRAPGPSADLHIVAASGSTINGSVFSNPAAITTGSGTGWGLSLGFGFDRFLAAYATIDNGGSQATYLTGGVEFQGSGSQTLYQVDAGLRAGYPLVKGRIVPYGVLAYSRRMLRGDGGTIYFGSGTYSEWGAAVSYGLGLLLYASPHVALDLSYQQSAGTYSRIEVPGVYRYSTGASSTASSRFLAGVTWQIGPVGLSAAPPPPSDDTMSVGEYVRLRLGGEYAIGTVLALHRDSVFLQRIVHDSAAQIGVPRECVNAVDREVPTKSVKMGVTNGAFLGAIGGTLIGAILSSKQASAPQTNGPFLATYVLGGAVVGGALGAVFGHEHSRWQPMHFEATPSPTLEAREAVCRQWYHAP